MTVRRVHLVRFGEFGRVYLPEEREDVRKMLVELGGKRTPEPCPEGFWILPWHAALEATERLRDNGRTIASVQQQTEDDAELLRKIEERAAVLPYSLTDKQKAGALWLARPGNKLLADDCGCGKTVQAVLATLTLPAPRLVVAPSYLVPYHWPRELRTLGEDRVSVVQGTMDKKQRACARLADWVLISCDTQWRSEYLYLLAERNFRTMILDESYRFKNPTAKRTKAVRRLGRKIPKIIELCGIPMDKSPDDLFTQLQILDPKAFGNRWDWQQKFCIYGHWWKPLSESEYAREPGWRRRFLRGKTDLFGKTRWSREIRKIKPGVKNPRLFREVTAPYILKRTFREMFPNAPAETGPELLEVPMHPKQAGIYAALLQKRDESDLFGSGLAGFGIRVRQALTTSATIAPGTDFSGKFDAAERIVEKWVHTRNIVLWTHWRQGILCLLARLEKLLKSLDRPAPLALWGDTAASQRGLILDEWRNREGGNRVMVCNPTASSLGENFVTDVPVLDLWVEKHAGSEPYQQGLKRFLRASSTQPVHHMDLVHPNTHDEDVETLTKQAIAAGKAVRTPEMNAKLRDRILREGTQCRQ